MSSLLVRFLCSEHCKGETAYLLQFSKAYVVDRYPFNISSFDSRSLTKQKLKLDFSADLLFKAGCKFISSKKEMCNLFTNPILIFQTKTYIE